jgi:transposase-like protein
MLPKSEPEAKVVKSLLNREHLMSKQRKIYSADFKAKVALAAIKGQQTINEIASTYSVHPNQVTQWKKHALGDSRLILGAACA